MSSMENLSPQLEYSREDKPACLEAAEKLHTLSWLARKEGLLALADAAEQETDTFLKATIETLLDALWDEKHLEVRLAALLEGGAHGGNAQKNLLIARGLLCIHSNVRPDAFAERIQIWLGADCGNKEEET